MLSVIALGLWWMGGVELEQVRAGQAAGFRWTLRGFTVADLALLEAFGGPLRASEHGRTGD